LPRVYVQEFRDFPVRLRSCGPTRMVCAELYPWGAIRLLGGLGPTSGVPCRVPECVPERLTSRIERMLKAGELNEGLGELEAWLLQRATQIDLSPSVAVIAAEQIFSSRGQGTVSELADHAGLSVRQLERLFHAHVGMSPKLLGRLSRFEAAQRTLYEADAKVSLTQLAHELGFADQAHFTREFRAFSERSPSGFVTEVRDFLRRQGDVAFVQAERAASF
jgi:AraC-like DNA-binding protein